MPVFRLTSRLAFPDPRLADPEGLLAVGGDLSVERLVLAYSQGIFPWYSSPEPILWWSPDPRLVLFPDELRLGRSLRRAVRRAEFRLSADTAFDRVVASCSRVHRPEQRGTWITPAMRQAYGDLHEAGVAHSVEAWEGEELVGGAYGVALGDVFFGESMFARRPDASKVAFTRLVGFLRRRGCTLIDCQMDTEHLRRFGARLITREDFLERLERGLTTDLRRGSWTGAFAADLASEDS